MTDAADRSRDGAGDPSGTPCVHCGFEIAAELAEDVRKLVCPRCGLVLWRRRDKTVSRSLAFALCGLIFFVPAIVYPVFSFEVVGRRNSNFMLTGVVDLAESGAGLIAALVLMTSIAVPLLRFVAVVLITTPIALGRPSQRTLSLNSAISKLDNWAMLDVYLLAIAVTYAKLSHFGSMSFGPGWPALLGVILSSIAVTLSYSPQSISRYAVGDGGDEGARGGEASPHHRKSLALCEALLLTGIILVVPAYSLSIMTLVQYGHETHPTVYGAVLELTAGGQYLMGGLMFTASIVVPIIKLIVLSLLVLSIRSGWAGMRLMRTRVYVFIERIGRWSFVDFFVVSMMVALAKLGVFATASAEPGLLVFAGVVLSTLFAASALDSRLFWNNPADVTAEQGAHRGTN